MKKLLLVLLALISCIFIGCTPTTGGINNTGETSKVYLTEGLNESIKTFIEENDGDGFTLVSLKDAKPGDLLLSNNSVISLTEQYYMPLNLCMAIFGGYKATSDRVYYQQTYYHNSYEAYYYSNGSNSFLDFFLENIYNENDFTTISSIEGLKESISDIILENISDKKIVSCVKFKTNPDTDNIEHEGYITHSDWPSEFIDGELHYYEGITEFMNRLQVDKNTYVLNKEPLYYYDNFCLMTYKDLTGTNFATHKQINRDYFYDGLYSFETKLLSY